MPRTSRRFSSFRSRIAGALLTGGVLAGACVALDARADQAADEAAVLMKDAGTAYEKGDFQTCRAKATEAWGKFQHAQIAGLLGTCEVKLEMYVEGATHLDFYVKNSSGPVNPESLTLLQQARQRVSEVALVCTPGDVNWKIDGKSVPSSTSTVFLEPGPHTIEAQKEGYKPKQEPQQITAGTKVTVQINLEPEPKGTGGEGGAGGGDTGGSKLAVWPGVTLLGVGAVGIGVGIGLLVAASGNDSDAVDAGKGLTCDPQNLSQACQGVADSLSAKDGLNTGGTIALTVGGALAVTGAILLPVALMGGSKAKDEKPADKPIAAWTIVPIVSPLAGGGTFGGATWMGSF